VDQRAVPLTDAFHAHYFGRLKFVDLLIIVRTCNRRTSDACVRKIEKNFKQNACSWWGIKNQIFVSSLNTLSSVTSERYPSPRLCARAHTLKSSDWLDKSRLSKKGIVQCAELFEYFLNCSDWLDKSRLSNRL